MPYLTSTEYLGRPWSRADFVKWDSKDLPCPCTPGRTDLLFQPVDVWDQLYGDQYKLVMYSTLPDGSKAKVVLMDVPVTFDLMVPPGIDAEQFKNQTIGQLHGVKTKEGVQVMPVKIEVVEQLWCKGFTPEPYKWLRLYFKVLKVRNAALSRFCKLHEEDKAAKIRNGIDVIKYPAYVLWNTANDYGGNFKAPHNGFPLKVIREHGDISPAGWNKIPHGQYKIISHLSEQNQYTLAPKNTYVIEASLANVTEVQKAEVSKLGLAKSPALALHWDIEAHDHTGLFADIPNPEHNDDTMFMASFAVCRISKKDPLHSIIAFFVPGMMAAGGRELMRAQRPDLESRADATYIVCNNEYDLCNIVINVLGSVLPDYWVDFNGLGFDQKYLLHRLNKFQVDGEYWTAKKRPTANPEEGATPMTLLDKFAAAMETPYDGWPRPFADGKVDNSFKWGRRSIKISPEKQVYGNAFQFPGLLYIDARPVMMQVFTKESASSLRVFLKASKLPEKHDMPVLVMYKLYKAPTSEVVLKNKKYIYADFVEYALYDAVACHSMFYKSNIYVRWMATANISGTTLFDAYYHAGGMKARNMITAAGLIGTLTMFGKTVPVAYSEPDSRISSAPDKEKSGKKYPGAYVITPTFFYDGKCYAPVGALDFASLYPSIIMTDNISHETMVYDEEFATALRHAGWNVKSIEFPYGDELYRAWVVRYKFKDDIIKDGNEIGMGVLPTVLSRLKSMRGVMKNTMAELEERIEAGRKNGTPTDDDEYELSVVDGEQKALKVLMNTFYGECGNQISPFFFVGMAGAITSYGQSYLRYVKGLAEAEGFNIIYGDTDSIYGSPPFRSLADVNKWHETAVGLLNANQPVPVPPTFHPDVAAWAKRKAKTDDALIPSYGTTETCLHPSINDVNADFKERMDKLEEEWRSRCVIIAMYEFARLNDIVNKKLVEETGTKRLTMAYEEVLFPCSFFGKKKYVGVQNTKPDRKLIGFDWRVKQYKFIRGLDFIKRGNAPIMREIGEEAVCRLLDINNKKTVRAIIEELILELPAREWGLESFVKSAEYKPTKDQKMVKRFVERMTAEVAVQEQAIAAAKIRGESPPQIIYHVPEPGERFDFVMVKKAAGASTFGYKIDIKAGDKMEYPEVVIAKNLQIDLEYYMSSSIRGLLARLISYDKEFRGDDVVTAEDIINAVDRFEEDVEDVDDEKLMEGGIDDEVASVAMSSVEPRTTDAKAVAAAGKVIQKMLKAAFSSGMQPIDLNAAKNHAKEKVNAIKTKMSASAGFSLYVDCAKNVNKLAAKGKVVETSELASMFDTEAKTRSAKIPTGAEKIVKQLMSGGRTIDDVYQMFMGERRSGQNKGRDPGVSHMRQDVLMKEHAACLAELREIDILLDDTNVFDVDEPDEQTMALLHRLNVVYYRLVGVHGQIRTTAEIIEWLNSKRSGVVRRPANVPIPMLNQVT